MLPIGLLLFPLLGAEGGGSLSAYSSCITSDSRRRGRECWERTPVQSGSAGRPRDSGQVLLAQASSQRRRRATVSRCCYWRPVTSAATQISKRVRWIILILVTHYNDGAKWLSGIVGIKCTSTLHKHSSRLETTSENSGLSCGGNFWLLFLLEWMNVPSNPLPAEANFSPPAHKAKVNSSKAALRSLPSQ